MRNLSGLFSVLFSSLFSGLLSGLFPGLLLAPAPLGAQETAPTILVLDASGSMWGQIDGKAKITIAQEVIGDLLQTLPAQTELGLTVYGHRRKGDCGDIETMILPDGDQRAAIATAVNAISPKGKTPLSAAVIAAAEALKYREEKATVILVSDGRETCDLNTCLVGQNLEAAGIDFTAHVIGFDISDPADRAELKCLADETGGTFTTAGNAAELSAALAVVSEPAPAPAFDLTFIATEGEGGPAISQGLSWTLGLSDAGPFMAQSQPGQSIGFAKIPQGTSLFVRVVRQPDGASADLALVVDDRTPATSILVLPELPPEPQRLSAQAREEETGRVIDTGLVWTILDAGGRVLVDARPGADPALEVLPGVYTVSVLRPEDGASASQRVELRDMAFRAMLELPALPVPAPLSLNAREEGMDALTGRDLVWVVVDRDGQVVMQPVTGPDAGTEIMPGEYRVEVLRQEDGDRQVLDFRVERGGATITVVFPPYLPPAGLDAPQTALAGARVPVGWTGPDEALDHVTVGAIDSADGTYINYEYTRTGSEVMLLMPAEPGSYELRYVLNDNRRALARRLIEVSAVMASLESADTAAAGADVSVAWTGPGYDTDYIDVALPGAGGDKYINYAYVRDGSPAVVQMPTEPGAYELRYIMAQGYKVLASRTISVGAVDVTLDAPEAGAAGATIDIAWNGPGYRGDYVTVAEPGMADSKYIAYTYTDRGNPLQLDLPLEPGAYELRYVIAQDNSVAARVAIDVTQVGAGIKAAPVAMAGSQLDVTWEGPDYRNDYITIAEPGMKDSAYLTYAYIRGTNPLAVQVPALPGRYELRYVAAGTPQTVLARMPLEVGEVTASLHADASATAGGTIEVTWEGPDYRNDYIALSKSGDKGYETYTYTRSGSPATLKVPQKAGSYEIRYVIDQDRRVIATIGLTVK